MDFIGSHILSIDQFERADIDHIFSVARMMEPYAHRHQVTKVLDGAILGNMFFEPSTRTCPDVGTWRHATRLSKVDLPLPESP